MGNGAVLVFVFEALEPGQVVVVKAGERIPVDGTVVEGESHADESLLTGKSNPVVKRPGDATAGQREPGWNPARSRAAHRQ